MLLCLFVPVPVPVTVTATVTVTVTVQVLFMSDQQLIDMHHTATTNPHHDVSWDSFSSPATTAVLSHFPEACNCAVASPDGQWVAVVGDASCLQLLHASQGYTYDTGNLKPLLLLCLKVLLT